MTARQIVGARLRRLVAEVTCPGHETDAAEALTLIPDAELLALVDRYPRALPHLARHHRTDQP